MTSIGDFASRRSPCRATPRARRSTSRAACCSSATARGRKGRPHDEGGEPVFEGLALNVASLKALAARLQPRASEIQGARRSRTPGRSRGSSRSPRSRASPERGAPGLARVPCEFGAVPPPGDEVDRRAWRVCSSSSRLRPCSFAAIGSSRSTPHTSGSWARRRRSRGGRSTISSASSSARPTPRSSAPRPRRGGRTEPDGELWIRASTSRGGRARCG